MIITVGRVARAHGVRGEVLVEVRTDNPDERFAAGVVMLTEPATAGPLTVNRVRWHSGRLLVVFDGVAGRDAAEALRGVRLLAEIGDDERPDDPDEFFDHQLLGLRVVTVDGTEVGHVREVIHAPAQDLLAVVGDNGEQTLIPFVTQIVPEVDLAGAKVTVDPPPGLLDSDEAEVAADGHGTSMSAPDETERD